MINWLLDIWYKVLKTFAKHQLRQLREDLLEIDCERIFYKKWYNLLILLFIIHEKLNIQSIYTMDSGEILRISLPTGEVIEVPITEYNDILHISMNIPKSNVKLAEINTDYNSEIQKVYRYLCKRVLEDYNE